MPRRSIHYALVNSEGIVNGEFVKGDKALGEKYGITVGTVKWGRGKKGYVIVGKGHIAVPIPAGGLTDEKALEIFRGQKNEKNTRTTDQCIEILRTWWEENGRKPYTKIPSHLKLSEWARRIRLRREKLKPDVRQQLDAIGFPWEVRGHLHGKPRSEQWD